MKLKTKRRLCGLLCFILCFTMNINPAVMIATAVVESGIVDDVNVIKDKLLGIMSNDIREVYADETEDTEEETGYTVTDVYNLTTIVNNALTTHSNATAGTLADIQRELEEHDNLDIIEAIQNQTGTLTENMEFNAQMIMGVTGYTQDDTLKVDIESLIGSLGYDPTIKSENGSVAEDLTNIQDKLDEIKDAIEAGQHEYRVAHLYSLNNQFSECLWKPYSKDVPYVEDFATVTGRFANVYSGYWDTSVQTITNPGGQKTQRALEILGYDALIRHEGVILQNNLAYAGMTPSGLSGQSKTWTTEGAVTNSVAVYYKELIPEKNITWLDAVTVLYKALGQHEYTYQSFMAEDPSITPETSPAVQGLSGVTEFDGYDFYMFLSRNNVVSGNAEKQQFDNTYWRKAVNDGFVNNSKKDDVIVASDFFILATSMMQAYGEPVINDDEIKALLQVYGSNYPIQLGVEIADAWAYLKVRGIINEDIEYSASMTRDQLLNICMCIADKDSRSDYKSIQVILDIADVYRNDGYFPVYDMEFSQNEFTSSVTYDYSQSTVYHYLIPKRSGYDIGNAGDLRVSSAPEWTQNSEIRNGKVLGITEVDGQEWYVLQIPKTYNGSIYLTCYKLDDTENHTVSADVKYIEIPSSCLGGGFFKSITKDNDHCVVDPNSFAEFDTRSADKKLASYVDYKRAQETKPAGSAVASNATILEILEFEWNKWTTPEVVYAAHVALAMTDGGGSSANINLTSQTNAATNIKTIEDFEALINGESNDLNAEAHFTYERALKFYGLDSDLANPTLSFSVDNSVNEGTAGDRHALITNVATTNENYNLVRMLNRLTKIGEFEEITKTLEGRNVVSLRAALNDFMNNGVASYSGTTWYTKHVNGEYGKSAENTAGNQVIGGVRQKYSTFMAQFLAGTYPIGLNVYTEGYPRNTWFEINSGVLGIDGQPGMTSGSTENKLSSNISKLITDNEDKFLTELIINQKATSTSNGYGKYKVEADDPEAVLDLLAGVLPDANSSESGDGSLEADLNRNVASSVIMNRDEQILIKWSDLLKSKTVVDTFNGGQPKLTEDGNYYFYTKYGQVKVNDSQHTIQIGTTLYDVMTSDNAAPRLWYVDNETKELYFDYRCVMGAITADITRNDEETELAKNSLGAGDYVVYDIGSNEGSNFNIKEFNCYNYPEIPSSSRNYISNLSGYKVPIITNTQYDGRRPGDAESGVGYWTDVNGNAPITKRLQLNAFVPTANWLFVIDSSNGGTTGTLYVYYLKEPFENGFDDNGDGTLEQVTVPDKFGTNKDATVAEMVETILNITQVDIDSKKTISTLLAGYYNMSSFNEESLKALPWYDIMSIDAIADLYDKTGKFLTSPNYVVRRFELSASAPFLCYDYANHGDDTQTAWGVNATENTGIGNLPGMCYWIDTIGMIYNLPSRDEWSLEGYLNGEWLLPIAYDNNGTDIINFNMNSYGTAYDKSGKPIANGKVPFGYVLTDEGYNHYKSGTGLSLNSQLPKKENGAYVEVSDGETSVYAYPFSMQEFKPAPVGIYYYFGGNPEETLQVSAMTSYVVDTNKVYYGTHQLKMQASSTQSSSSLFFMGSESWAPFSIDAKSSAVRVHRTSTRDTFVLSDPSIKKGSTTDIATVIVDDYPGSGLDDLLDRLGANSLVEMIDSGASWLIIIAFNILPMIGIIMMTILVGLSFISDNKVVQAIAEKTIDPIKLMTFGAKDIHRWHWKTVLFPCILLYVSFALFLNGNLIRIVQWLAKWYDIVMQWVTSL